MWIKSAELNLEVVGEENQRPVTLLVHGAGGQAAAWRELAGRLAPDYRTAALDLSGHGQSPRKSGTHDINTYADDILAAIQALGGGPVVLCGHSMGGALALHTALHSPDMVRALVLANTGARLRVLPALLQQLAADFPAAVQTMSRFAFAQGADPDIVAAYAERLGDTDPQVALQDFTLCDSFDIMARMGEIKAPALIIGGEHDTSTPPKYSAYLHHALENSTLHIIPGIAHMSMLEAPGEFASAAKHFHEKYL